MTRYLIFLIGLLFTVSLYSQSDTTKPKKSTYVSISEQVEADISKYREIGKDLKKITPLNEIKRPAEEYLEEFEKIKDEIELIIETNTPTRKFSPLQNQLSKLEENMETSESDILKYSELINTNVDELDKVIKDLQDLVKYDTTNILDTAVTNKVSFALTEMSQLRATVMDSLKAGINLKISLSNSLLDIEEYQEQLKAFENISLDELIHEKRISYLEEMRLNIGKVSLAKQFAKALSLDLRDARAYFQTKFLKNFVNYLLFFIILISTVLLSIYYRRHMNEELGISDKEKDLITSPILGGLFIFVFVAFWLNLFGRPRIVSELMALFMLLPMIRFMPKLTGEKIFRIPVIIFAVLLLINNIRRIGLDADFLHRSILLFESVVAIILMASINLNSGLKKIEARWWKIILFLNPILILLIVFAIGVNFYGAVKLAGVIVDSVVLWVYFALLLVTFTLTVRAYIYFFLRTPKAQELYSVKEYRPLIERRTKRLLSAVSAFLFIYITLLATRVWDTLQESFLDFIETERGIGSLKISIGDILAFVVVLVVSIWIARFIRFILLVEILPRTFLSRGAANAATMLIRYFILFLGFLLALAAAGINITALGFIGGALGVGIGFGLQNIVANFISGLILAFERPVNIGDIVKVGLNEGIVQNIGARASVIKTWEGSEVIVPNSEFISKEVINWTLSDVKRRREILVSVETGNDPEKIIEILRDILQSNEDILKDPEPMALYQGYQENFLNFRILFWIQDKLLQVPSDVNLAIQKKLKDSRIEIPVRKMEVVMVQDELKSIPNPEEPSNDHEVENNEEGKPQ